MSSQEQEDDDDGYPYDDEEPEDTSEQCSVCGANVVSEDHDWDCPYAGDEDDDDY